MPLSRLQTFTCIVLSLIIVAFGQPYWSLTASFLASVMGFALFFRALASFPSSRQRFFVATAWFAMVQLIQFSWFLSHPYLYIIAVYILLALIFGLQFGFIGWLACSQRITSYNRIVLLCSCWTLLEWSRLFILSGIAFNPIGLSLSANLYTLQSASLGGAFGMSFWVLGVNLLALKAWLAWPLYRHIFCWLAFAAFPFIFGFIQLKLHDSKVIKDTFNAILVQPVFPTEENMLFHNTASYVKYVEAEWQQILMLCKEHLGKNVHLIALPEFIVPFTTYTPVYPYQNVKKAFLEVFGEKAYSALPLLQEPLASQCMTEKGSIWMVTNGYWLQGLANIFNAPVLSGMEDVEDFFDGHREYYSSAQFVEPSSYQQRTLPFKRYDKRVLVPMGEYIPFSFCRSLAAAYGITGSFTPGKEAKIFPAYVPFGASICYEETFGHLMRENRLKGAELIVNLTSDVWYPTVAQQHCDHARLRTTENGIPLIRACNTGITGGFDAFGREIKILGNTYYEKIWKPGALYLQVPLFSYKTLYSITGDYLIVFLSVLGIGGAFFFRR
ncbi:Apolipoprotein N-acyltransferase [Neochlamydia sp. AcF65]|uniref:apolipoprotein N-acyltransferase n=1 Tax=Neochlamydia sp. AcF65 TaxID=2795735 RepID=UPI001BC8E45C|nr:apolipoprotein N-acyltransferase [Neochlamydia sp. AcF65]MBS4166090.1 Apolipoprotein N-acyltransferase [Neochlamydia sp. AcF65]